MSNMNRRSFVTAVMSVAISMFQPVYAQANDKPITLVVPYAGGGTNDSFARLLAEGMSKELGRHVIVENKGGANGIIGSSYVARSRPDGTTFLLGGTGPISLNIMLRPDLQYDFDSFDSVAMLFEGPLTISTPTSLGVNSLDELVAHAKKSGKPLMAGTMGPGSVTDLYNRTVSQVFGIPLTAVAYKNNTASLIDLMAGRGDLAYATPIALIEHHNAGNLKILALTTDQRDPAFPDIPAVAELGYPQLKASYWTALHAPKGTPVKDIEAVSAAAVKTVQSESFRKLLRDNGQTEKAGGPTVLDAQLQADRDYWGKIIRDNNIVIK